jgi:hypothetical protein
MRKRPPGRQTDRSTNCTVARRGLLVAPYVCFRTACVVEGSNARPDRRKLMRVSGTERNIKRRYTLRATSTGEAMAALASGASPETGAALLKQP